MAGGGKLRDFYPIFTLNNLAVFPTVGDEFLILKAGVLTQRPKDTKMGRDRTDKMDAGQAVER